VAGEQTSRKALGVLVSSSSITSQQRALPAQSTSHIPGCIKPSTTSWSTEVIIPLYLVLVWPLLEYSVQFWAPQFKKNVKATKLVKGLEGMSCEERLRTLGLSSAEKTRLRGDLIALYSFLRRGPGEGGAEQFSLVSSTGCMAMAQSCARGGLDWALGSISLLRGWSNTGTCS